MGVGRENIARCHERTKKLPGVPDSYTVRKKWFEKKYKTHTNCTVKSSTHPKIALTVACVGACALEGKFSASRRRHGKPRALAWQLGDARSGVWSLFACGAAVRSPARVKFHMIFRHGIGYQDQVSI
jgi:hypothetical protein